MLFSNLSFLRNKVELNLLLITNVDLFFDLPIVPIVLSLDPIEEAVVILEEKLDFLSKGAGRK